MIKINKVLLLLGCMSLSACVSCSESSATDGSEGTETPVETLSGDVKMYVTTSNRVYDLAIQSVDFSDKDNMSPTTVRLDASMRYQTMDGFGAAMTGSTSYFLS